MQLGHSNYALVLRVSQSLSEIHDQLYPHLSRIRRFLNSEFFSLLSRPMTMLI